jgi:pyruvate kinase
VGGRGRPRAGPSPGAPRGDRPDARGAARLADQPSPDRPFRGVAGRRQDGRRAEGLAELVEPIRLRTGGLLALTRANHPGHPVHRDDALGTLEPARIHGTLPEAFDSVTVGDRVYLDDGKIGGTVSANDGQQILVHVGQTPGPQGAKLRAEKGINFPDTELNLPCLTSLDVTALEAIVRDVHMVALSFVRRPEDLDACAESASF